MPIIENAVFYALGYYTGHKLIPHIVKTVKTTEVYNKSTSTTFRYVVDLFDKKECTCINVPPNKQSNSKQN